ncbi:hypothetical protein EW093_05550 [Thiospirochaeta perfilievii]|uniref:Uncharacterized protein n=1 Tax=Thiospirochaeta perfilievii TaxID=252967 RepID=A0A5C1QAW1_9SPIO|nr:hypothetical protein [Thiospirochaeta perfilievii]QEN04190.1 hypothetical protein EW093_05550 [Thiospirochaeta perfilievii]
MKRIYLIIILLILNQLSAEELELTLAKKFPKGTESFQLGFRPLFYDIYFYSGPSAFTIDSKDNFYIKDTMNSKIKKYDNNWDLTEEYSLSRGDEFIYIKNMYISNDTKYIYSTSSSHISYLNKGKVKYIFRDNTDIDGDVVFIDNKLFYTRRSNPEGLFYYIENGVNKGEFPPKYNLVNFSEDHVEIKLEDNLNIYAVSKSMAPYRKLFKNLKTNSAMDLKDSVFFDDTSYTSSEIIGFDKDLNSFWIIDYHNGKRNIVVLSKWGECLEYFTIPGLWYRHKPTVSLNGDLYFMLYGETETESIDFYSLTKESRINQRKVSENKKK